MKSFAKTEDLSSDVRNGIAVPTQSLGASLQRIEECESSIGAWEFFDKEQLQRRAQGLDSTRNPGPLHGLTVGVKDIIDTHDMPTSYGSPIYVGHRPAWDASIVAELRSLGALIVGKTVTTEFAHLKPGRTANPHDLGRTPGGSSSGSAAAVASGMVAVALGTQTGGSIIRPASFCGVVGFKPSFGRFSMAGVKPLAPSLDTLGFFSNSVDGVDLVATALSRRTVRSLDSETLSRVRIGYLRGGHPSAAESKALDSLDFSMGRLRSSGVKISDVSLPLDFDLLTEMQMALMAYEASRSLAFETATAAALLSETIFALIERGDRISEQCYFDLRKQATVARADLGAIFEEVDVIVTLSAPGEAPLGLTTTGDPVFNRIWTLLQVPCISLPVLAGHGGLPVGMQLIGRYAGDDRLLAIAKAIHLALCS